MSSSMSRIWVIYAVRLIVRYFLLVNSLNVLMITLAKWTFDIFSISILPWIRDSEFWRSSSSLFLKAVLHMHNFSSAVVQIFIINFSVLLFVLNSELTALNRWVTWIFCLFSPVDCIHWTSAAQISLLEDEMRRVERVNVSFMVNICCINLQNAALTAILLCISVERCIGCNSLNFITNVFLKWFLEITGCNFQTITTHPVSA